MAAKKGKVSFAESMQKRVKAFRQARATKKQGGQVDTADIIKGFGLKKDGASVDVVAKLSKAFSGTDKNGNPYVSFSFVSVDPDSRGQKFDRFHGIKDGKPDPKTGKPKVTSEDRMEWMFQDFQALGYETDSADPDDVEEWCAELTKEKPACECTIKRNGEFIQIFLNGLSDEEVDDEDLEDEDEEEEEEVDDEGEEEEEDDDDEEPPKRSPGKKPAKAPAKKPSRKVADEEDEDEEEDEEEEEAPAKKPARKSSKAKVEEEEEEEEEDEEGVEVGDEVNYKGPRAKKAESHEVLKINHAKQLCDLRRLSDDKEFKGVPLDDVEVVYED